MTISLRTQETVTVREEVVMFVGKNSGVTLYLKREFNFRGKCWKSSFLMGEALRNYLYRPVVTQAA